MPELDVDVATHRKHPIVGLVDETEPQLSRLCKEKQPLSPCSSYRIASKLISCSTMSETKHEGSYS